MPEAVIVSATRSPIGRANKGSLKDMRPDDLTAAMIRAALDKIPALDPKDIDDLYLGCGLPGGESGFNMARIVSVLLGYDHLPGATVTRYCSSSVQTSRMAFHAIKAGEGDVFISAGVETVSRFRKGSSDHLPDTQNPLFDDAKARTEEMAKGGMKWQDPRESGGLPDAYIAMGQTAENVAQMRGLSRQELDEFGVRSQNLAEKAIADGFWANEITPVTLPDGTVASTDDGPRAGVTLEGISQLDPVFRPDGVVTAGNCCPLNDGAAAVVIMSDTKAKELGLTPLARIVSTGVTGLSPEIMGLGPVEASKQALARANMTIDDIDLVEINEAFAAQVVPSYQDLGIDIDKLNVNGGAIAVGHPFGMTGARLQNTMLNSLQDPRQADRPDHHVRRRRPGHGAGPRAHELTLGTEDPVATRRPPVDDQGAFRMRPWLLMGSPRADRAHWSCWSTAWTATMMSILSPTRRRPPSIGTLKSTPHSLREICVVPSKPARVPPHGSVSVPTYSTSRVTGLVTPLRVRSPVTSRPLPPCSTLVLRKVIGPLFSTSKKSPERRWASRFSSRVLIEFRSMVAVAAGWSPVTIWPSNCSKRPRTLLIR